MKRGTQFLILSFLFALCCAHNHWDDAFEGELKVIAQKTFPLPYNPNLSWVPSEQNVTDLLNNNNSFLRTFSSVNITAFIDIEIEHINEANAFHDELVQNITAFLEVKAYLDVAIADVLKASFDAKVQDYILTARNQLRAIAAKYREAEIEKYQWWFETQIELAEKLQAVRQYRLNLLYAYRNASVIIEGVVDGGCAGLSLIIKGGCNRDSIITALTEGLLANLLTNLTNTITSVNNTLSQVTSNVNTYNADLHAFAVKLNETLVDYVVENTDYQNILQALKNFRSYELPTWEDIVARVQELLYKEEEYTTLKRLITNLYVGWQLGLDGQTLTVEKQQEINETVQEIKFSFSVLLTKINQTLNETLEEGAQKFEAAVKTAVQTYSYAARLFTELSEIDNAGLVTVHVTLRFVDIDNAIQAAWIARNIEVDPSQYEKELDDFINSLTDNAEQVYNEVNATLAEFIANVTQLNQEAEKRIESYIEQRTQFYKNASEKIQAYVQKAELTAKEVANFSQEVAQNFLVAFNQTVEQLQTTKEAVLAEVAEAEKRVVVLKTQAAQIAIQILSTNEQVIKDALQETLDSISLQLEEALQYREFKKQLLGNVTVKAQDGYEKAKVQHDVLVENAQKIAENATVALVTIKERIRDDFNGFVETVRSLLKGYRASINQLNITAGSDLEVNTNASLTFTVVLVDTGLIGEEIDIRYRTQVALLKAIFASITTDVNIRVTRSTKRQTGSDVYTVQSGDAPTPTPTPTPVATPTPTATPTPVSTPVPVSTPTPVVTPVPVSTPTPDEPANGAMSAVMSVVAIVACLFITLF